MSRRFDHHVLADVLTRLKGLSQDAVPRWGSLTPAGMVRHLVYSIRYSMGLEAPVPSEGNWLTRRILGPLLINGFVRIPRNVRVSQTRPVSEAGPLEGEIESLHAALEAYLGAVELGEMKPEPHPLFGGIGVDGWGKLHVIHFEHHMRQFGI